METKIIPQKAPFSIGELRRVVPSHCFERSLITSFRYTLQDLIVCSVLMYTATYIDYISNPFLRWVTWFIYWTVQGFFLTGLWVIAHECGHGSFSAFPLINDTVGCILHTALLVPYWSWKYSHAKHHANTSTMTHDTVFVPSKSKDFYETPYKRSAIGRFIDLARMMTIGWQTYLLLNIGGQNSNSTTWESHFNPWCNLWSKRERLGIFGSDMALIVFGWILYRVAEITSWGAIIKFHLIPYMWVNFWLLTITFLQHTDLSIPHYKSCEWTWLRGVLATVDRDYGVLNILHHHIADTHVLHHMFSKIPHYHAVEASEAIKKSGYLNDYYHFDNTPWYVALWRSYSDCRFVTNANILWYSNMDMAKNK
jgi:omega-6 fatty acid desaturase (delta-12 desaturase)